MAGLSIQPASSKPVIFISYSHKDEPEKLGPDDFRWLSFVQEFLQPAVNNGIFDLWNDRELKGGDDWDPEIENKLRACDIFILLVSARSMASHYIVDKEIAIIRERQVKGEPVHFYPLLLTPTPKAGLDKVRDKNLRPRDAKPFSGFSPHDRKQHMSDAADEIAEIARLLPSLPPTARSRRPTAAAINFKLYPVHVMTRKSFGLMTRKLSVTESQRSAQFPGTFSRRKLSVASANWAQVA